MHNKYIMMQFTGKYRVDIWLSSKDSRNTSESRQILITAVLASKVHYNI